MPSSVAHALTAAALGALLLPAERSRHVLALGAAGAVLLDLDAIGRPFGLGDVEWLGGHRALTHSLAFAAVAAAGLALAARRARAAESGTLRLWTYLALALASHGALDALTVYGEGVAFLAPVSAARFKLPWQPLDGLWSEVAGVWLPALAVIRLRRRRASPARAP